MTDSDMTQLLLAGLLELLEVWRLGYDGALLVGGAPGGLGGLGDLTAVAAAGCGLPGPAVGQFP
eukprot:scaffold119_cov334-Pinguiococcus_pyrenoidosus.AAC.1